jgi:hypothetical protein
MKPRRVVGFGETDYQAAAKILHRYEFGIVFEASLYRLYPPPKFLGGILWDLCPPADINISAA